MRKIPKLTSPTYKNRTFVLKDFGKSVQSVQTFPEQACLDIEEINADKFYYLDHKYFAYSLSNNRLYIFDVDCWRELLYSTTVPSIMSLTQDGQVKTLILGDTSYILENDLRLVQKSYPSGKNPVVYKDMLFISNGNQIRFSTLNDYEDFSIGLDKGGFVKTDIRYGEIIALIPTNSALVVFCERAIYHLIAVGERNEYKLIKQDLTVNANVDSVQCSGGDIYFYNFDALCIYKDGKINKVDTKLGKDYFYFGNSSIDGNTYFAVLSNQDNEKYLYTYNGFTGKESLIRKNSVTFIGQGYFIENKQIKKLNSLSMANSQVSWQGIPLDFDTAKIKTIIAVQVKTNQPMSIELEYSYGKKLLNVYEGFNEIKLNVTDKAFKLKVNFYYSNTNLEQIKFIYRLQED